MKMIYLDYAATTPVDPRVAEKMFQCLTIDGIFGNPASAHAFGKMAKEVVENARTEVAELIAAEPHEIIWTSGATEADNLALKGIAQLYQQKGKHLVTAKTEHSAVLDCCQELEKQGFQVTYLDCNKNGIIDREKIMAALRPDTILVSLMQINNETGIIQDIASIGKITRERGILFHVDAAQSAGKIPIDVNEMNVDLMSLCAHKIYGPKGVGALYVRKKPRVRVAPQIHGGGHESGMRAGTLAPHQIVGMGEAFRLAKQEMQHDQQRIADFSKHFLHEITKIPKIFLNTDPMHAIPNIINLGITGMKANDMMSRMPELAISSGSACHSKGIEPSHVLRAMGLSFAEAAASLRFSFGRFTTASEIETAIEKISAVAKMPLQF